MQNEKGLSETRTRTVKEATDPFNGIVAIFEDTALTVDARFWTEQQRKDEYTGYLPLVDAEAKFDEFVSDCMY